MRVRDVYVSADRELELARAAGDASTQLLLRQGGEPSFDEVDPGRARRREVQMKAGMPGEPPVNRGRLVRAGVVEDEVDVEAGRDARIDDGEELAKLAGPLPLVERASRRGGGSRRAA